ncbi:MAG: hypothetical protein HC927_06315 [Deltaproteobacteria bacterium]|nr:hypothetical protein [Deltaproteobacteria bacterium]
MVTHIDARQVAAGRQKGMTIPRRILPHTSWLITRRCSERRFFLLPSFESTQIFEYALARAARITGVQLHAWMVMSNHYHLVVTDTESRLPEFVRLLNSFVARALNFHYKRKEAFWKPGSYSAVQLCSKDTVLDKMAYTLMNPVVAGLVRLVSLWEGSSSYGMEFGQERVARRPLCLTGFLKSVKGDETLRLTAPPNSLAADMLAELQGELKRRVKEVWTRFAAEGRRFLGMDAVSAQSWQESAKSEEPRGGIIPRFASKDPELLRQAIREWRAWLTAYRLALQAFSSGVRDAEFPAGTYMMKQRFDVVVARH